MGFCRLNEVILACVVTQLDLAAKAGAGCDEVDQAGRHKSARDANKVGVVKERLRG